jgi:hypothetical protein
LRHHSKQTALLISIVTALVVSACAVVSEAKPTARPADTGASVTRADRTNCAQIGNSDLHSPLEGIWYQTNCLPASRFPQGVASTICNRPSLAAAEFRMVAPGLFTYRQTHRLLTISGSPPRRTASTSSRGAS